MPFGVRVGVGGKKQTVERPSFDTPEDASNARYLVDAPPHLVILPAPAPEGVGEPINPPKVRARKRHGPADVLGVPAVAPPDPRDVHGPARGRPAVVGEQLLAGQEVHIVKDVHIVVPRAGSELEADVEELPAVELAPVVALLHDVDVEGRGGGGVVALAVPAGQQPVCLWCGWMRVWISWRMSSIQPNLTTQHNTTDARTAASPR